MTYIENKFNDFCEKECTGGDRAKIKGCDDRWCPFYPFRFMNLEYQNERKRQTQRRKKVMS